MSATNGNGSVKPSESPLDGEFSRQSIRNEGLVMNEITSRMALFQKLFDPRRSIPDECGHPASVSAITIQQYQDLYDLDPIAARVVECLVRESWQVNPLVFEKEAAKKVTPFELRLDAVGRHLRGEKSWFLPTDDANPLWEWVRRADEVSGIGSFGLMLLGFNDKLPTSAPVGGALTVNERPSKLLPLRIVKGGKVVNDFVPTQSDLREVYGDDPLAKAAMMHPQPKATEGMELLSLRVFPESLVQIAQFETNPNSPRRGQPIRYAITLNDPRTFHGGGGLVDTSMLYVHWSRVLHLADDLGPSEIFGKPRMQQVLPRILDLRKLYGGDAEAYWKNMLMRLFLETHPSLGGQVKIDIEALKTMMENMDGGQRWGWLSGLTAKTVAPTVVDPTSHIMVQIEAICIKLGIPKRVFMGSERGELASSQDDQAWNDRLKFRQNSYITPRIIMPLIDRLICVGVLSEPQGYHVQWPDLTSHSDSDRAGILTQKAQAYATYISGNVESLIPPMEWMTKFDNLTEEQARAILGSAAAEYDAQPFDGEEDSGESYEGDDGGASPFTDEDFAGINIANCGGEGSGVPGPCKGAGDLVAQVKKEGFSSEKVKAQLLALASTMDEKSLRAEAEKLNIFTAKGKRQLVEKMYGALSEIAATQKMADAKPFTA